MYAIRSYYVLLWASAAASVWFFGADNPEGLLWAALLIVQSLPYGAALLTSMAGSMPRLHQAVPRFFGFLARPWRPRTGEQR